MEIVIAAVVVALGLAIGLVAAAHLLAKRGVPGVVGDATAAPPAVKPQKAAASSSRDDEALARSAEIGRQEERLVGREEALDARSSQLDKREQSLARREQEVVAQRDRLVRELERASGMSASQAKHHLLKELEDQVRHESARLIRRIEDRYPPRGG